MAKLTHEDILAYLEEATILELNDLVKAIEEKFDVTAAAPVAVAAAADAGAAAEPTEVNVTLTEVGGTKVAVIKAVREITGLGLVDAKGLVDKAPSVIKEKVSADEAKEIKEKLEAAQYQKIVDIYTRGSAHYDTSCVKTFRDILVFKNKNKIVGISKICFDCGWETTFFNEHHYYNLIDITYFEELENLLNSKPNSN